MARPFLPCVLFLALSLPALNTLAQDGDDYVKPRSQPKKSQTAFKDRIYWGGILGLSFGTVTNIAVEPIVAYKLGEKQRLSLGTGISYWYFRDDRYRPAYESNTYGYKFFARHRVIPQAFLHAEYNSMNFEFYDYFTQTSSRDWVPFLLLGGGYSAHLGGNSYMTFMALWDVLLDSRSPYTSGAPWFSMGFGVGF